MVYVWLGARVKESQEDIVKLVQEKLPGTGAIPKMVRACYIIASHQLLMNIDLMYSLN